MPTAKLPPPKKRGQTMRVVYPKQRLVYRKRAMANLASFALKSVFRLWLNKMLPSAGSARLGLGFIWLSFGCVWAVPFASFGCPLAPWVAPWLPLGCPLAVPWLSLGCSPGCPLVASWRSPGKRVAAYGFRWHGLAQSRPTSE